MATFFFCGIGGIGMSAIALYLKQAGHQVFGSDRSFDQNKPNAVRENLLRHGIALLPQDGSGVTQDIDVFVVSSAVEPAVPDVAKALSLGLTVRKRAEVLADIFNARTGIAVGGTSGKTTVTAMIGHILYMCGKDPTMINGGIGLNTYHNEAPSNLIFGQSDLCVIEADESDGSIALYAPHIAVLTNISLDHKPIAETKPLFEDFINRARIGAVVNWDCDKSRSLSVDRMAGKLVSFSVAGDSSATLSAQDVSYDSKGIHFRLNDARFDLPFIGRHNLENALAAAGACLLSGIPVATSLRHLTTFSGTKRRLQTLGVQNGVTVIDDYGHNTEKIKASLQALQLHQGHIYVVYQPHGFAPLRMMKAELTEMLKAQLDDRTEWIMSDVFYAGGTVTRDVSSADVITPLAAAGKRAHYIPQRADIQAFLTERVKSGDIVVVMGARDDTLTHFAQQILVHL